MGMRCGIMIKLSQHGGIPIAAPAGHEKDFEKSFEKGLTRSSKSGIINKLSQGAGSTGWTAAAS